MKSEGKYRIRPAVQTAVKRDSGLDQVVEAGMSKRAELRELHDINNELNELKWEPPLDRTDVWKGHKMKLKPGYKASYACIYCGAEMVGDSRAQEPCPNNRSKE